MTILIAVYLSDEGTLLPYFFEQMKLMLSAQYNY